MNMRDTTIKALLITVTALALSGCADMSATEMTQTALSYSTVKKASNDECEGQLLSTAHIDVVFDRLLTLFPDSFVPRGKSRYANVSEHWRMRALEYQVIPGVVYSVAGFVPNGIISDHWMHFDIQHNPMGGSVIHYNTLGYTDCADTHLTLNKRLAQGINGPRTW